MEIQAVEIVSYLPANCMEVSRQYTTVGPDADEARSRGFKQLIRQFLYRNQSGPGSFHFQHIVDIHLFELAAQIQSIATDLDCARSESLGGAATS